MKKTLPFLMVCLIASAMAIGQHFEASGPSRTLSLHENGKALKMVVEVPPNDRVRLFHVNREICAVHIAMVYRDLKSHDRIGPVCRKIARKLYAVNGITDLTFTPYDVQVEIGDAFT